MKLQICGPEPEPTVEANQGGTPISPQPKESRVQPTWRRQVKRPASYQPKRLISHAENSAAVPRGRQRSQPNFHSVVPQCSVRLFRKVHRGGQHLERLTIKERDAKLSHRQAGAGSTPRRASSCLTVSASFWGTTPMLSPGGVRGRMRFTMRLVW